MELIDKAAVKAIIERMQDCTMDEDGNFYSSSALAEYNILCDIENRLDTLEVKESDETAEAFARIIRANLTGIDKDVQYKFEQLYKEITGEKMYQGYKD